MSTGAEAGRRAAAPRVLARTAGLFYLLTLVAGVAAQSFVSDRLIDFADAASTAANIGTHAGLFRWGFTLYLVEMVCQIASTALFYLLLRPVSGALSLVAAFLGLAGCTIKAASRLFYIAPLFVLDGGFAPGVFPPEQLQALALLLLKVNDLGAGIALAFFGFFALLKGYLIFRATFLPRTLGVLGMVAGLGLLTFLSPDFGSRQFVWVAAVSLLGAAAQVFWLLAFGVNEQRWKEQARAALPFWRRDPQPEENR